MPRTLAKVLAAAAALTLSMGFISGPALADSQPADPANPATPPTVSSDPLPTAQIDGVAWQQVIVGDTVYVAGKFSTARPAGAPDGTGTVARNNLLAFSLTTGELIPGFAPNLNAQALAIAASPDGTRIYVGGDFTAVNGVNRSRVAALDAVTGAVIQSFDPRVGGSVRTLAATNSALYIGGTFTTVGTAARNRLAAVSAANAALLPWAPSADEKVNAMVLSPDASQLVIGGAFTSLNGSNKPGYGLARVDAGTGESLSLGVNDVVRNAGTQSAILTLASDGTSFYGGGYIFGTGGNLEGMFSANWSDGNIKWIEDCHGDTYGVYPGAAAVYVVGHPHYCGNLGGFPETTPRSWHRAVAFSTAATRTLTKDTQGYPSFTGQPAPELQNWFPDLDTGTASGQSQGPWAVGGNANYVVMVGEFLNVNQKPQQGLVRFALKSIAPNKDAPRVSAVNFNPTLTYQSAGQVKVGWTANWDRDNENLSYQVFRDGNTAAPVYTVVRASRFYNRPALEFTDTGLFEGSHSYRIRALDPFGNFAQSDVVAVDVPVGVPNAAPAAAFTAATTWLTASVDGSGSADPDGSISSYTWDFGDGTPVVGPGTGATASHQYAAAGTYTVALTVTDNRGGTNSTTRQVSVSAPPADNVLAADSFGRTVSSGLGTAERGGAWTLNGTASLFAVAGGSGRITMKSAGAGPSAYLNDVAAAGTDVQAAFGLDKLGNGGGTNISVLGRRIGSSNYQAKAAVSATGALTLSVRKVLDGTETSLASKAVSGLSYAPGGQLLIRMQAIGTNPTSIKAKIWAAGAAEPATWAVSASDAAPGLQSTGSVGLAAYLSGTANNAPVVASFDNLSVTDGSTGHGDVTPVNAAPAASFTTAVTNLAVAVDGLASTDSDGTVTSYAWDFGDGGTAAGATASHSYTADGTYPVSLTVTDDDGAANSITQQVTVAAPPPNVAPAASFTTAVTYLNVAVDGSGSTDADGTVASYAWDFGDGGTAAGATASHNYAAAATYTVSLTVTDDDGATNSTARQVSVSADPVLAADAFARTLATGLGTADRGGVWTLNGASSLFAVGGGVGKISMKSAAAGPLAYLNDVSSSSTDLQVAFGLDKLGNAGGTSVSLIGRRVDTANYQAKVAVSSVGALTLSVRRVLGGTETVLATKAVSGLSYTVGSKLLVRLQVTGTSPSTISAKIWAAGAAEPAGWSVTAADSAAGLQSAGSVGLLTYLSGTATNAPVVAQFDDLSVKTAP